ncbi:TrkA family potassium uptake protein (plasmid) [Pseudalkalibacillus hwajinpoensis]|uniref:potassium channel family protein n=1 Tax=Guptibacillus hwajinpoensis TaxID=208199 RepID=UPI00325B4232
MKKSFAVIGLGRFGGTLCKELNRRRVEVLGIDKDMQRVNEYSEFATQALVLDATIEENLQRIGIRNFDHVFVSHGDDLQSSILTTLLLKEMGVKKVWVKAKNDYHHKVLEKIGADHIIHPESEMAKRLAHHVVSEKIIDYVELSDEYSIVEVIATKKIAGKTLLKLDTRAKFGVTIVAIKKRDRKILVSPSAESTIDKEDVLVVIGNNDDLERFEEVGV